jgi:hypothetical protein
VNQSVNGHTDETDPISVQDGKQDTLKSLTIDDIAFEMDITEQEDEIDDDGDEEGFGITPGCPGVIELDERHILARELTYSKTFLFKE